VTLPSEMGLLAISGIQTKGVVRCDQSLVLDIAATQGRKLESLAVEFMDEVLARLGPFVWFLELKK